MEISVEMNPLKLTESAPPGLPAWFDIVPYFQIDW